jgi:MscS family membrane protein
VTLACLAQPALAQTGGQRPESPAPKAVTDPFGRDTPRGTIAGLNAAVHRDDFVAAARYLQLTPSQRANVEPLARDLTQLIDRYYTDPITSLSDAPEGSVNDGLPLDRERVALRIAAQRFDIELVRIDDAPAHAWLITSQTLAQVPAWRQSADRTWLERTMPRALVENTLLGFSIARLVAWAATLVIPYVVLSLLARLVMALARRFVTAPARRQQLDIWYGGLRRIVILAATLAVHLGFMPLLGFSLRFRFIYSRIALIVLVIIATWLLWRFMALSFANARHLAQRRGEAGISSLLLLAERVSKVVVVMLAIFGLLTILGVDTTTALAGVGIGGVAVALGAQKSVENLLGGVFLLTDRALAVGDTCSISNRIGVVEDITMRSVRLRTMEQTLLSVPAGVLSQSSLENFATRNKILVQSILRLRYGTTTAQLRQVLTGIRALLDGHRDIETPTARIRLVDFGVRAIELELFAYVLTSDFQRFLEVREELLLQVAALIESSGTGFAQPTDVHQGLAPATAEAAPR